jgi:hypothetical protein
VTATLLTGVGLTLAAGGLSALLFGDGALWPAIVFGLVGLAIHLAATHVAARKPPGPGEVFPKGFLYGMALRMGGVVLFAAAAFGMGEFFLPLPTAIGFLGVLVPLLFLELRTIR